VKLEPSQIYGNANFHDVMTDF